MKEQSKIDNPEKLATLCTQDTGGRQSKTQKQKTKEMSNTDRTKTRGRIQMVVKSTQFLLPIRHPACYST